MTTHINKSFADVAEVTQKRLKRELVTTFSARFKGDAAAVVDRNARKMGKNMTITRKKTASGNAPISDQAKLDAARKRLKSRGQAISA